MSEKTEKKVSVSISCCYCGKQRKIEVIDNVDTYTYKLEHPWLLKKVTSPIVMTIIQGDIVFTCSDECRILFDELANSNNRVEALKRLIDNASSGVRRAEVDKSAESSPNIG